MRWASLQPPGSDIYDKQVNNLQRCIQLGQLLIMMYFPMIMRAVSVTDPALPVKPLSIMEYDLNVWNVDRPSALVPSKWKPS